MYTHKSETTDVDYKTEIIKHITVTYKLKQIASRDNSRK